MAEGGLVIWKQRAVTAELAKLQRVLEAPAWGAEGESLHQELWPPNREKMLLKQCLRFLSKTEDTKPRT